MFRELSSEESDQVKKWRAPSLQTSDKVSNPLSGESLESFDTQESEADEATTDIAHLRHVIRESQVDTQASNDEFTAEPRTGGDASGGNHTSVDASGQSADMLQQTYDEGYSAGIKEAQAQADSTTQNVLASLLSSLAPQKYQMDADIEQELVSLSKAIAKMLMRREVETDDGVIVDIVRRALERIPMTSVPPSVVLHPDDLNIVESMQTPAVLAKLIPDATMMRGDCRIESGASIMDAGVDALVDSISSSDNYILPNDDHYQAEIQQDSPVEPHNTDEQP